VLDREVKIKKISELEIFKDPLLEIYIRVRAFRLLGIMWTEYVEWYKDLATGNIIFRYK
jgi:hypothetical protein